MSASAPFIELERFSTFGDLLKYLRRRAGLTQRELSIAVGYSIAQISRLEQNLRLPDLAMIAARFIPALDVDEDADIAKRLMTLAAMVRAEDAPASGTPPYKGLNYFNEADAELYFGREALVEKLRSRLLGGETGAPWSFLAVVGASGSGKSSVVRAGLVHALRRNSLSTNWPVHVLTPTAHPLEALAVSLTRESESITATATLMDDLSRDARALHLYVRCLLDGEPRVSMSAKRRNPNSHDSASSARLVLVVDQFEELFTLCQNGAERAAFVDNLLTAAFEPDGPTCVVIALRADFYPHCASHAALRTALAEHQEYIGSLNADELRRAIEEPARCGGWELEAGLADMILHDINADGSQPPEPGALPLLSHALLETWQRRRGRTLTLSGYLASGGVREAIAETAESVFRDQLDAHQQAMARTIFLCFAALGDDQEVVWTRRRVAFDELTPTTDEAVIAREVLTCLADARLITISETAAEVAHEALLREWPRLRAWLAESQGEVRLQRQLTHAAAEWESTNRDVSFLLTGARLAQFDEWLTNTSLALTPDERVFYGASLAEHERLKQAEAERQRHELETAQQLAATERARADEHAQAIARVRVRNRLIAAAGGLALVLAIVAGLFSLQAAQQRNVALNAQVTSQANFAQSERLRWALEANAILDTPDGDPATAALLSLHVLNAGYLELADAALLKALPRLSAVRVFSGHTEPLIGVAFSPDGKYVATASYDLTARLWDIATGEAVHQFSGHRDLLSSITFSPDGKYVLTGSYDGTARLWDVVTGKEVRRYGGLGGQPVFSIAFSPDGQYVAASGIFYVVLWDATTAKEVRQFNEPGSIAIGFTPDGRYLLTGSGSEGAVRVWEVATSAEIRQITGKSGVRYLAVAPDGKTVLIGWGNDTSELREVATGAVVRAFGGGASGIAFSPDGQYVIAASQDKTARLWDVATGQEVRRFNGHTGSIASVAFSPDGSYVATAAFDNTAILWKTEVRFRGHTGQIFHAVFSPDGQYILTASDDNTARLWDAATGVELRRLSGHTDPVIDAAFSPDGKYALTASLDGTARLWETATGQEVRQFSKHTAQVFSVAFSPDGKYALTGGVDETAWLWELSTGKAVRRLSAPSQVYEVAFSPDGKYILTASFNTCAAQLWDASTGAYVRAFTRSPCDISTLATSVAFSPDGKYVLMGSILGGVVPLWDIEKTDAPVLEFVGHTAGVLSVAFSPDGKYVLTGSEDDTARVWDAVTGQLVRVIREQAGVRSAVFSPDGKYVLTGSADYTARIWDTDYRVSMQHTCARLLRDLTDEERQKYGITDNTPVCPQP